MAPLFISGAPLNNFWKAILVGDAQSVREQLAEHAKPTFGQIFTLRDTQEGLGLRLNSVGFAALSGRETAAEIIELILQCETDMVPELDSLPFVMFGGATLADTAFDCKLSQLSSGSLSAVSFSCAPAKPKSLKLPALLAQTPHWCVT